MKPDNLEEQAVELPAEQRAALAQRLSESLGQLSADEAEKLWLLEAARRAGEVDSGEVKLVTGPELEMRINARFK